MDNLVNGAVILGIPDDLAWSIYLEGKDIDTVGQWLIFRITLLQHLRYSIAAYEHSLIKQFITLFPVSPLASLLKGYYEYIGEPISEDQEDINLPELHSDDDPFDVILVSGILHAGIVIVLT